METRNNIQFGKITLQADRPFLIAEAGVNYENDINVALRYVEEAAASGADAIKFQSYKAETIASRFSPSYWDTSKEPTRSQYELFKKYDHFDMKEYRKLADRARECGIHFMSTPFDIQFVDDLNALMSVYKIASADITNFPFLRHVAQKGKPMILSTGASTIGEVDTAVTLLRDEGVKQIALLHCVLSYPCKPEDANLGVISYLKKVYPDIVVGYSDHVPPAYGCAALITAWLLGARFLEKHFTLDKTRAGNDHYHAMDPQDIRDFRAQCDYVTSLLGRDRKDVLPCEAEPRRQARRSLVAARAMKAGEIFTAADIAIKRPGTGLQPEMLDVVIGRPVKKDIREDEVLSWDVFLS